MSVELLEEAGGKILILNLNGKLAKEDYAHFTPEVERAVKANGKVRMLVRLHDFHGWTMGGLWEDVKFDMKHFSDVERLAMIGDRRWEAGMAAFCKPFTAAKIRYFDLSKADEANEWIHEGVEQAVVASGG